MSDERHPVELLADQYAEALRAGNVPAIEEYATRYPEHADAIRAIFPTIDRMESARRQADSQASHSSASVSLSPAQIPPLLGDFFLRRQIGRGGMGIVFEAQQESLKRRVALKVLTDVAGRSARRRERFRREAEAAAELHHTNIVAVYGTGEDAGFRYYAMQLIEGVPLSRVIATLSDCGSRGAASWPEPTLRDVVRRLTAGGIGSPSEPLVSRDPSPATFVNAAGDPAGALDPPTGDLPHHTSDSVANRAEDAKGADPRSFRLSASVPRPRDVYDRRVAELIANVASALQHAHDHGVLHRDIKPSNLMLDTDGTIWVTDFGVAKREHLEDLTHTGELVGTLRYMAPEQFGGDSDARSDVYSLGLVLFELLTLTPAFQGPSQQWVGAPRPSEIASPRSLRSDLPRDLEVITQKALAPEASDRYQTASALEADLRRFLADQPILARPESVWRKTRRLVRRNPAISALTVASLALLATIVGLLAIGYRQQTTALDRIAQEYIRAESNLAQKTTALQIADQERERAEDNLRMALEAFSQVVENIGSRGGALALLDDLQGDQSLVATADATLSAADVELLQTLLDFFDQFATVNRADLSAESAAALHKIGDIQQRLGRLDEASDSYRRAQAAYERLEETSPDDGHWRLAQIKVINERMVVAAQRGRLGETSRLYRSARQRLQAAPELSSSPEGKFALAKVCTTMASQSMRSPGDQPPLRVRAWLARERRIRPSSPDSPRGIRLQREIEAIDDAIDLLAELRQNDPENIAYRLNLVRALRQAVPIRQRQGNPDGAAESLRRAIELVEQLQAEFPESNAFQYELAETLQTGFVIGVGEMQRLVRAMRICDDLVREHPESMDYRSLRATILTRLALLQWSAGNPQRAMEALQASLEDLRIVAGRFPDVAVYQLALARTLLNLTDTLESMGQSEQAIELIDQGLASFRELEGQIRFGPRFQQRLRPILDRLQQRREELAATATNGAP